MRDEKKDTTVQIRLSETRKAEWRALADADGVATLTKWLGRLADDRAAGRGSLTPADRAAVQALSNQIRSAGSLLNSIAAAVAREGMGRLTDVQLSDIDDLLQRLPALANEVDALIGRVRKGRGSRVPKKPAK